MSYDPVIGTMESVDMEKALEFLASKDNGGLEFEDHCATSDDVIGHYLTKMMELEGRIRGARAELTLARSDWTRYFNDHNEHAWEDEDPPLLLRRILQIKLLIQGCANDMARCSAVVAKIQEAEASEGVVLKDIILRAVMENGF